MIRLVHILDDCRCYHRSMGFKDHFSSFATHYNSHRPGYPEVLFEYLASLAPDRELAWDCATGNGQAARGLAVYFDRVVATDASEDQIQSAVPCASVEYRVEPAEEPSLEEESVDLVLVAQALHWLDWDRFYPAATRVMKPGAVFAAITYELCFVAPAADQAIDHLYRNILQTYWPPERIYVQEQYRTLPFPYRELKPPQFQIEVAWTLDELMGYLGTWSAVNRYREDTGEDPLELIAADMRVAWGDTSDQRMVTWPMTTRVGRKIAGA